MNVIARWSQRLAPADALDPEQVEAGLRWWHRNGIGAQAMDTLAAGAFVTAFALELGASSVVIGVLAAIPHLAQIAQIPGVYLNERWRNRRLVSTLFTAASRPMFLVMAAAAFVPQPALALAVFTVAFAVRYVTTAFMACGWNAWIRDLVPETRRGRLTGRRLATMTAAGAALGLAASGLVDWWKVSGLGRPALAYCLLFVGAFAGGAYSTWCMARMPEPRMAPAIDRVPLLRRLGGPFRDPNYRRLLLFLGAWNFAVNIAVPFFMVHMLKRLGLDLWVVMALTLLSQVSNLLTLRRWGVIADHMSNKSVLQVCAPIFVLCIFAWTFTTFPEPHPLTIPLLVVIHVLTGFASAGVTLASGNIALKLAPAGNATAYLADNSLVISAAAGTAPMVGGLLAHFFTVRELSLQLRWRAPGGEIAFNTISISQWDFFFAIAALLGLLSLLLLARVREVGEVEERIVLNQLYLDVRRFVQNLSSIAGLRQGEEFPVDDLRAPRGE